MTTQPRVFVSSVIEGFEQYRQAARIGIEKAGGEPVLVNEDSPSLSSSSRNACLDAIESCDVLVLVLGKRGGWRAPSGRLVVEEEFEHARTHKLAVLVFLEDVSHDADVERFSQRISDYVDGVFRVKFSGVTELRDHVERSLKPMLSTRKSHPMDSDVIAPHLVRPHQFSDQTTLRLAIAPERTEEVFDPLDLASPSFTERILELGHSRDLRLFDYFSAKEPPQFRQEWLVIEQPLENDRRRGRLGVRLAIAESGAVLIDTNVTGREPRETSFSMGDMMAISIETVESLLDVSFRFVHALYQDKDPHKRHQRFYWNSVLTGIGYRKFERNPRQQNAYSMGSDRNEPLPAFTAARPIARGDLAQPSNEIERAILYWQRDRTTQR